MKKSSRKIALALSAFMLLQPLMYADAQLNKEIVALELEITKMKTKVGEYHDMNEKQLEKKISKAEKTLEKKKAKAKKEAEKDAKNVKKDLKKAGKKLQSAGKDVGDAVKSIFDQTTLNLNYVVLPATALNLQDFPQADIQKEYPENSVYNLDD